MSDLAFEILDDIKNVGQYSFSSDNSVKQSEEKAIQELIELGYIRVISKALGYIIAEPLM